MQGPHKGYTNPHQCATVNELKRYQPSDRDQQARQKYKKRHWISTQVFMALFTLVLDLKQKETNIIFLTLINPSPYT